MLDPPGNPTSDFCRPRASSEAARRDRGASLAAGSSATTAAGAFASAGAAWGAASANASAAAAAPSELPGPKSAGTRSREFTITSTCANSCTAMPRPRQPQPTSARKLPIEATRSRPIAGTMLLSSSACPSPIFVVVTSLSNRNRVGANQNQTQRSCRDVPAWEACRFTIPANASKLHLKLGEGGPSGPQTSLGGCT